MAPIDEYDLGDVVNALAAINTTLIRGFGLMASIGTFAGQEAEFSPEDAARRARVFLDLLLPE